MKKMISLLCVISCFSCIGMDTPPRQDSSAARKSPTRIICDPTYDITFKSLFNEKEEADGINGKQRAISFLNGLLDLGIVDINFLPTYRDADYTKTVIFDVLCECSCRKGDRDYVIDVEIQKAPQTFYFDRSIFYASKTLVERSERGQKYKDIPNSIVLSFLDFEIKAHKEGAFCGRFMKTPINIEGMQTIPVCELSDKIRLYYFQLPIVYRELTTAGSGIDKSFQLLGKTWLSLLSSKYGEECYKSADDIRLNEALFNDTAVKSAISILESFRDGEKRDLFLAEKWNREDASRLEKQVTYDAEQRGKAEGIQEGILQGMQRGIQEGIQQTLVRTAYRTYKSDKTCKISKRVKAMSIEEIQQALSKRRLEPDYSSFIEYMEYNKNMR